VEEDEAGTGAEVARSSGATAPGAGAGTVGHKSRVSRCGCEQGEEGRMSDSIGCL